MKKLVADMLILARNDIREQTLSTTNRVALSDLVTGSLLSFEAVALERDCYMEENITSDLSLSGDSAQLPELVNTLLDNACKYAPSNSITFHVTLPLKQKTQK